jgi:hypothetical protein
VIPWGVCICSDASASEEEDAGQDSDTSDDDFEAGGSRLCCLTGVCELRIGSSVHDTG